jgi:hypothetical protein
MKDIGPPLVFDFADDQHVSAWCDVESRGQRRQGLDPESPEVETVGPSETEAPAHV